MSLSPLPDAIRSEVMQTMSNLAEISVNVLGTGCLWLILVCSGFLWLVLVVYGWAWLLTDLTGCLLVAITQYDL